jgi:hypothetical protein
MKRQLLASAAVALAVTVTSHCANAATITYTQDQATVPTDFITSPSSSTGNFVLSTTGSTANVNASPFPNNTSPYSCLSCGVSGAAGTATYTNTTGSNGFSIFWGSPDAYNEVLFYDGGTLEATVIGSSLLPPSGSGHNLVSFDFNGQTITSVVLEDTGTAAFEYSDVTYTPLPAALPLFAGGLGMIGFLGHRRKRKTAAALTA